MQTDVLVMGAGPAGSSAAYHLAREGLGVLLVDRAEFPREKICGGGLTQAAVEALARMGVLCRMLSRSRPRPFMGVRTFAPDGGCVRLAYPEAPRCSLLDQGYVIRRDEMDEILMKHAVAAGAEFLSSFLAVEAIHSRGRLIGVSGRCRDGRITVRADLIVLATGANVRLGRIFGLHGKRTPSMLTMQAFCHADREPERFIDIRLEDHLLPGYGWVFPVDDETVNVGIGLTNDYERPRWPARRLRLAFDRFVEAASRQSQPHGASLSPIGVPRGRALYADFASTRVSTDGALAVGEAAGLVDPLTGEGISLALESGQLAAQHAANALSRGDLSARSLSSCARALSRRYRSRFSQAACLRSKLSDSVTVNGPVSLSSSVSSTQAGLVGLRRGALALGLTLRSLPVLGLSPFLALRLFKDQYGLI
jgi:geranylgeranyl reductase family protein